MLRATLTGALLAGTAFAQVSSPLAIAQGLLNFVSDDCRNTIYSLVNSSSPQYQCLQVDYLLPAITTNGSIIPPVDNYLHQICSSAPCNSTVLNATASAINSGCSAELQQFGVSSDLVDQVIGYYGLARDVVCLKNENQEVLANATIPLNSTLFNTTSSNVTAPSLNGTTNSTSSNGTFCLTEFALNVTGYLGVNLTNSYVDTLALGGNYSALRALEAIPPTALCSDCIFAAVNLINEEIPQFGQIVVNSSSNTTINSYLDNTCSVQGYNATGNGTLPDGIFESGVNSTSSLNTTSSATPASASSVAVGVTSGAASVASAATATAAGAATAVGSGVSAATSGVAQLAGRMAEKRRWVGQQ